MSFTIKASFKWGEIFAGKFDVPMQSELQLSTDYYLIYSNLDTSGSLDLASLFNKAFNTHIESTFTVNDAGFFTYSKMSQDKSVSSEHSLIEIFPDAPLPKTVKESSLPVLQTTSFWASFDFRTSNLFSTLLQIGYDQGSTITLSGTFSSAEEAGKAVTSTSYEAHFDYIKLLSLFEFKDLTLKFRFDQSSEYSIAGDLSITLFKDSGGGNYIFRGDVHSNDESLTASISSQEADSQIVDPFGFMRGVTFRNLLFGLVYQYENKTKKGQGAYRIQGSISYQSENPKNTFDFTGQIFLSDTTPIIASMFINQNLDIGAIFNNTFGSSITWPTNFINLVFHKNSQLYYCNNTEQANKISRTTFDFQANHRPNLKQPITNNVYYEDGFNLDALFDLTILTTIKNIHGKIQIQEKGVTSSIQLVDIIDLWVLQLKAPDPTPALPSLLNGPLFEFDSAKKHMVFHGGLEFFQANFGLNVEIKASKDQNSTQNSMALEGKLESAIAHDPFIPKGTKLTFSYDQKNGLKVNGWEAFNFVSDAINYIEEIQKITNDSGSSSCGKIVGFAFDQVKNSYKMSPDLVTEKGQLFMILNGTYSVSINLSEEKVNIFDLQFPQLLKFQLPNTTSFDKLGGLIEQALKDAATSFTDAVIKNPDAIATFISLLAGKKAAEYGATLVCRGLADSSVATATEAGESALAGAGGLDAGATAALAAISVIAGITGGGGGGGNQHKSCFIAGTKVSLADGRLLNIEEVKIGDRLLGVNNTHNEVLAFDHPVLGNRLLYRFNQKGDYFVTAEHPFLTVEGWKSIDPTATATEIPDLSVSRLQIGDSLVMADGTLCYLHQIEQQDAASTTRLYNFKISGNHSYIANGYFVHNKGGDDTPEQPKLSGIRYQDQQITLSWNQEVKAKSYAAKLTNVKNVTLQDQPNLPESQTSTFFPIQPDLAAGTYLAQVSAVNGNKASAFSSMGIAKPSAPNLTISCDCNDLAATNFTLTLSWSVVLGTKAYLLHIDQQSQALTFDPKKYFEDGHYLPITYEISILNSTPAGKVSYALSLQSDGSYIDSNQSEAQIWQRLTNVQSFTGRVYLNDASGQPTLKLNWLGQTGDQDFYLYLEQTPDGTASPNVSYRKFSNENQASFPFDLTDIAQITTKIRVLSNHAPSSALETNQIPSSWSQEIVFKAPILLAKEAYQGKESGIKCAKTLINQYPDMTPSQMADTMAKSGYVAEETAKGLKKVYPNISAMELTNALTGAYGKEENSPLKLAQKYYAEQLSGTECALNILKNYPQISPQNMADVMAASGYHADQTGQGVKAAYPDLSALQFTLVLKGAYN